MKENLGQEPVKGGFYTVADKAQCNKKWFAANKKDRMQTQKIGCKQKKIEDRMHTKKIEDRMQTKKIGCKQKDRMQTKKRLDANNKGSAN